MSDEYILYSFYLNFFVRYFIVFDINKCSNA